MISNFKRAVALFAGMAVVGSVSTAHAESQTVRIFNTGNAELCVIGLVNHDADGGGDLVGLIEDSARSDEGLVERAANIEGTSWLVDGQFFGAVVATDGSSGCFYGNVNGPSGVVVGQFKATVEHDNDINFSLASDPSIVVPDSEPNPDGCALSGGAGCSTCKGMWSSFKTASDIDDIFTSALSLGFNSDAGVGAVLSGVADIWKVATDDSGVVPGDQGNDVYMTLLQNKCGAKFVTNMK